MQNVQFEVDDLPELDTEVAIAGTWKQQEVGGPACMGIILGIAIAAL